LHLNRKVEADKTFLKRRRLVRGLACVNSTSSRADRSPAGFCPEGFGDVVMTGGTGSTRNSSSTTRSIYGLLDLRNLPLFERKALLKKLIAKTTVQFSESFENDGPQLFSHACGIGLEGVLSKVRDSRYNSARTND
jgi:hypothetical protein